MPLLCERTGPVAVRSGGCRRAAWHHPRARWCDAIGALGQ
jgi:hypothetical protein